MKSKSNVPSKKHYKRKPYKKSKINKMLPKVSLRPELKFINNTYTATTVDQLGAIYLLNGVDQGVTSSLRIGNIIKMINYNYCFMFTANSPTLFKLAIVMDKQANGTAMALSDYLVPTGVFNYYPWVPRRLDIRNRFITIEEKEFTITPSVSGATSVRCIKGFKKLAAGTAVHYNGSGATIGAINNGALYLYLTANNSAAASFVGNLRIKFTDD